MRIDRMLAITVMLLNRDRISARELAEKFEVSVRTVYRDIEAINLAGIPVVAYSGNNGGFGIMENYKIDRQFLSLNDMLSILTALKGVNTGMEDQGLDSAIEKISSLIPKEKAEEMNLRFEQMVIDILPWKYRDKHKQKLKAVQDAISGCRMIKITYSSMKGEKAERIIEPMTLILKGYVWYLFAFCCLRNDYRIFRLSRIADIRITDQGFTRRKALYKDYFQQDSDSVSEGVVHLVLRASSVIRTKIEDYFDEEEIEVLNNGDIIISVDYPEDEWVYSMILSYGEYIEVLEPPHIRGIILEKAKKISGIYKPDMMLSQG